MQDTRGEWQIDRQTASWSVVKQLLNLDFENSAGIEDSKPHCQLSTSLSYNFSKPLSS